MSRLARGSAAAGNNICCKLDAEKAVVGCRKGDRVMITSSNPANVRQAMKELRDEVLHWLPAWLILGTIHAKVQTPLASLSTCPQDLLDSNHMYQPEFNSPKKSVPPGNFAHVALDKLFKSNY